ncbi:MAG: glycosyltransferase family 2 protein [Deltaproteobacteria bacterium]|nr:MAG: glycosyltransferase family 2 protein [Deltaproteobacteria bacterium]
MTDHPGFDASAPADRIETPETAGSGARGPLASVIVVTYHSAATIRACLEPLAGDDRLELIVVDNASRDDTAALVESVAPRARLIVSGANLGFAAGVNTGARAATADALVLLNPDTRTTADDLLALVARLAEPGVGIAAPRILDAAGRRVRSTRRSPRLRDQVVAASGLHRLVPRLDPDREPPEAARATRPVEVEVVSGACFATPRGLFELLGGLDTRFFLYAEEVDYCVRVRRRGLRVELVPTSAVTHLGGVSASHAPFSASALLRISRVRYFAKHRGRRAAAVTRRAWQLGALARAPLAALTAGRGRRLRAARAHWDVVRSLSGPLDDLVEGRPGDPGPGVSATDSSGP